MYIKKFYSTDKVTVGEFIEVLKSYPEDAQLLCCGTNTVNVFCEKDLSMVSIDCDTLTEDCFEE